MNSPDELRQENAALRERISMLNAAILRISASLDLDTVLREVVDGARALTGARYGMIATVDDTGTIREFVASGLSADERRHMAEWPHGYRFFEHLRDLPGALRLADVPAYVRSLGYSEELTLSKTLQAMPMQHRGVHVGNFFLGEKAGGQEFTGEDEEVLVLFASQAATAIANARTHRAEQRARADLEALVDTSPVGVVVFDANSGRPVSFKRWHQHLVDKLMPGLRDLQREQDGTEIKSRELELVTDRAQTDPPFFRIGDKPEADPHRSRSDPSRPVRLRPQRPLIGSFRRWRAARRQGGAVLWVLPREGLIKLRVP